MTETALPQKNKNRNTNLRVDLTPMVDLGFLLITFFVFTATISSPTAMTTLLPADSNDSTYIPASGAINLVVGLNEMVFYQGNELAQATRLSYSNPDMLREKLIALQQKLIAIDGNDDKLFIMIKPTSNAQFKSIVYLLDEMKICLMKRYTLTDLNEGELRLFSGL